MFTSWLQRWRARLKRNSGRLPVQSARLRLEALEDRLTPTTFGTVQGPPNLESPTVVNGTLFFTDAHFTLWSLSNPGASPVKVSTPGPVNAVGTDGSALYFAARDATNTDQLYYSTDLGKDNVKLTSFTGGLDISNLTSLNGWIAFTTGLGVYSTSPLPTWEVGLDVAYASGLGVNVRTGLNSPGLSDLTAAGNGVFILGDDGMHGIQLWHLAGPQAATQMLTDVNPGGGGLPLTYTLSPLLQVAGPDVYFLTEASGQNLQQLWRSDGTTGGTAVIYNTSYIFLETVGQTLYLSSAQGDTFSVNAAGQLVSSPYYPFAQAGGTTYYIVTLHPGTSESDNQLWGMTGGSPRELLDYAQSSLSNPTADNGKLYFTEDNGLLMETDGVSPATAVAAASSVAVTNYGSSPVYEPIVVFDGALFFEATPDFGQTYALYYLIPSSPVAVTQTSLSLSSAAVTAGQSVTLMAQVASSAGTPAGSVTFYDGSKALDTAQLNASGKATYTTTGLSAGSHQLHAAYVGSGSFQGSTSTSDALQINPAAALKLYVSPTVSVFGQTVTLTAEAAPGQQGTVTFTDSGKALGSVALNSSGVALLRLNTLAVGGHSLQAVLGGTKTGMVAMTVKPVGLVMPPGLVSWWPGVGNAQDVAGTNNGTLHGGATQVSGVGGAGFGFDGSTGYFQAPTAGLPTGNANRTLDLWVKIQAFVAPEAFFAGYGAFGSDGQTYQLGTIGSWVYFSQWGQSIGGPNLQTGIWYNVAVTNEGNTAVLFVDGEAFTAANMPINTATGSQFYMGRIPGTLGNTRELQGDINGVAVFNRALSAAEIQAIYKAGPEG